MTYESLLASPAIQALGRSLLHFLWQGAALAVVLWAVNAYTGRSMSRQQAARIRYTAGCLVMLLMIAGLIGTIVYSYPFGSSAVPLSPQPVVSGAAPAAITQPAAPAALGGNWLAGWVVCFWLAGVLLLSGRAAGGWMRAQLIKRRARLPVSEELSASFEILKRRLRVTRPVRLFASAAARTPMVIGWIRPFVFLPVTAV